MAERICSIPGCELLTLARGWCRSHYHRWRRHGDPLVLLRAGQAPVIRACSVDDCDRRYYGNGYCELHYVRLIRLGEEAVRLPGIRLGVLNGTWKGDAAGYGSIHGRVRRLRGNAREHICAHCEGPASQWAYDHTDPNELIEERRGRLVPYSTDPDRYLPLCLSCHTRLDKDLPSKEP